MLDAFIFDSANTLYNNGLEAIYSFVDTNDQQKYINALRHFTTVMPSNIKEGRRRIADKLIEDNKYSF